jgi:hypothetical protein
MDDAELRQQFTDGPVGDPEAGAGDRLSALFQVPAAARLSAVRTAWSLPSCASSLSGTPPASTTVGRDRLRAAMPACCRAVCL